MSSITFPYFLNKNLAELYDNMFYLMRIQFGDKEQSFYQDVISMSLQTKVKDQFTCPWHKNATTRLKNGTPESQRTNISKLLPAR